MKYVTLDQYYRKTGISPGMLAKCIDLMREIQLKHPKEKQEHINVELSPKDRNRTRTD